MFPGASSAPAATGPTRPHRPAASAITLALLVVLGVHVAPLVRAADGKGASSAVDWAVRPLASAESPALPPSPVWFRAWLQVPDNMAGDSGPDLWRDSMTVTLRDLPGPVTLLLNGRTLVETHDIPEGQPRRFKVPRGSFEKGAFNAVVLRLDG
ncbi:MAG: hypothetical protein JNL97_16395, partial [Verrucomicrobiales bacterium]|nr:hypothetical protein [Verrucomicrobiales bacterium]